jgi:glycogen debranching enzyme
MGDSACIGQISEIFEALEPHRPVGCPAQAWSVAEVLRSLHALRDADVIPERSGVDHAADGDQQRRVFA